MAVRNLCVLTALVCCLIAPGLAAGAGQAGEIETAVSARALQPGEVVRIDVTCACAATAATATLFGHEVPLVQGAESGAWRGLAGIDVETRPGTYPIRTAVERAGGARLTATRELVVVAKRFPTRRLTVAPRFVEPPAAEVARILSEARRLQALFGVVTPGAMWPTSFQAPVEAPPASSFGLRSVFNGQARSPHGGTDFPSPSGTAIAAPAAGSIVLAEELYFTGNTVVIDHGLGLYSLMAHLSRIDVKTGDRVERGQTVGLVGATGRVTGPHLHWAVRLGGARVDPLSLLAMAPMPKTATTSD